MSDHFLETRHVISLLIFADEHDDFISSNVRHIVTNPRTRIELLNLLVDKGLLNDTRDNRRLRTIHYSLTFTGRKAVEHIRAAEDIIEGALCIDDVSSNRND